MELNSDWLMILAEAAVSTIMGLTVTHVLQTRRPRAPDEVELPGIKRAKPFQQTGICDIYLGNRRGRNCIFKVSQRPEFNVQVQHEIRTLQRLKKERIHGIPILVDSGTLRGNRDFLIMPYYGISLSSFTHPEFIRRTGLTPPEQTAIGLAALSSVADILSRIHELGFIHGDVKPENILLSFSRTTRYEIYLIDWGFSWNDHEKTVVRGYTEEYVYPLHKEMIDALPGIQVPDILVEPFVDVWSYAKSIEAYFGGSMQFGTGKAPETPSNPLQEIVDAVEKDEPEIVDGIDLQKRIKQLLPLTSTITCTNRNAFFSAFAPAMSVATKWDPRRFVVAVACLVCTVLFFSFGAWPPPSFIKPYEFPGKPIVGNLRAASFSLTGILALFPLVLVWWRQRMSEKPRDTRVSRSGWVLTLRDYLKYFPVSVVLILFGCGASWLFALTVSNSIWPGYLAATAWVLECAAVIFSFSYFGLPASTYEIIRGSLVIRQSLVDAVSRRGARGKITA